MGLTEAGSYKLILFVEVDRRLLMGSNKLFQWILGHSNNNNNNNNNRSGKLKGSRC